MVQSFPVARSADFGNRPDLIGSRRAGGDCSRRAQGRWRAKDRFLLMTDALAQWFLSRVEAKADPLAQMNALLAEASPEAFILWVEMRRQQGSLRNDDVTLIVVDVG
jgi:hypothetical protein